MTIKKGTWGVVRPVIALCSSEFAAGHNGQNAETFTLKPDRTESLQGLVFVRSVSFRRLGFLLSSGHHFLTTDFEQE